MRLLLAFAIIVLLFGCDDAKTSSPAPQQSAVPQSNAAAQATPSPREGWPTEAEVTKAIFTVEHDIWASETNKSVWHVKEMRHEIKSIQLAQQTTQKQMNYGAQAITVYPVKVLYARITEYTDKPEVREEQGQDGVWFLYKDSFGNWTGKYGKE
jgi:hypothetical protein